MTPRLVAVAHGTRDLGGPRIIELLMRQVARRLADVDVVTSYLELAEPRFAEVMRAAESRVSWSRCCCRRAITCATTYPPPRK